MTYAGDADRSIVSEMESCYLDYAMSVIVMRALPDIRDGFKPVHRRILYAMYEEGVRATGKHRKSAQIVGAVLGRYHPHGDSSVYEAMVRMAQDFSMRYMLVDGQGNFGSMDGDGAAAMRYTEVKMAKLGELMLADIDKDTVDWRDNYDASREEPTVLPTRIPNLLLNGSVGIAVGMATNIPPHNLGELIDGLQFMLTCQNPAEVTIDKLLEFIKGPDFPTGGIVYNRKDIHTAYATGRGSIIMRGRAEIDELKNGRKAIIITEIPYQVNKKTFIEKIADLVQEKVIVGISDLRDESKGLGDIRIVIEMKKDAFPKKILNQLYKLTPLQTSFGYNMIALHDRGRQPKLFNLVEMLEEFLGHRKEVVTRRTQFELRIAEARAHILEGLKIALDNIDAVIKTIRSSTTKEEAKTNLMVNFKLSEKQTDAILEMQLQRLAGLERKKIEDELAEKLLLIADLKDILAKPARIDAIIGAELADMKER
ncbi:MAG: DNA gyrase/topoisomerase IV subunit A, partial [Patescibacteria group bacterium]